LLLIGLALLLVNLYVLVRARWAIVTRYGSRIYRRAVTLSDVATALLAQIQSLPGFSPEFYYRARGDLVISSFRDLLTVTKIKISPGIPDLTFHQQHQAP